jgi:predicted nucleic acid-binding protein
MRIPKIYLETTIFNFCFADDAPDKREDALRLFEEIKQGKYEPYTSDYVVGELLKATGQKRDDMVALIEEHNIIVLAADDETRRLAAIYVDEGVVPEKYATDALHIASTAVNHLDYIVSYNFKHIVKLKTINMTEIINLREHYKRIGIYSPTEVVDYEE